MPEEKNKKNKIKNSGIEDRFLAGILDKQTKLLQHLDTQTNILIGISSAMFAFMASGLKSSNLNLPQIILGTFSACTALIGLFAIHPPRRMRKKGQPESLMYNGKISGYKRSVDYKNVLTRIVIDQNKILEQYALEIYNVSKFYYQPKRKIFKIARSTLLAGVFLSVLMFFLQSISQ